MAYLILVRHGLTDWNQEGRWHGLTDIPINEEGREQSRAAAEAIKDLKIDQVYTSALIRTKQTYEEIKKVLNLNCPVEESAALNERDYGIYTGKNKWEVQKEIGDKAFQDMRRGWDYPIPEGETLKDVSKRLMPFYDSEILPKLKAGQNIMLVSSGNTLRALVKNLEKISDDQIENLELEFGGVYIYEINQKGEVVNKEVKKSI